MKSLFLIIPFLLFNLNSKLIAQKINEGIYLSANDFTNNKISFVNNPTNKKYKFHLYEIFNTSSVKIIIDDKTITLNKDSIFGYCDDKNISYRFYKKAVYKIINPAEKILLYSKTSIEGTTKNHHSVTKYFFSETANAPIYSLSKLNLKTVFDKNAYFHELLNVYFESDNELTSYDGANKIYLLNRIFEESKQQMCKTNNK